MEGEGERRKEEKEGERKGKEWRDKATCLMVTMAPSSLVWLDGVVWVGTGAREEGESGGGRRGKEKGGETRERMKGERKERKRGERRRQEERKTSLTLSQAFLASAGIIHTSLTSPDLWPQKTAKLF
jgi:hypothetical protein